MTRISLTDFVDIVSTAGTPKATKVKLIREREQYHPAFDFYKQIREHIISTHSEIKPKENLDKIKKLISDRKKEPIFVNIVESYKSWWGRKNLEWFQPPYGIYSKYTIDISVNPELGLKINGAPHLIKLYFKAVPLAKNKIDIITHLMSISLSGSCEKHTIMSVLDIQNKKLITPTVPINGLSEILNAEMAYISTLLL